MLFSAEQSWNALGERSDVRIGCEEVGRQFCQRGATRERGAELRDFREAVEQSGRNLGQRGAALENVVECRGRDCVERPGVREQCARNALQLGASAETGHEGRHFRASGEELGRDRGDLRGVERASEVRALLVVGEEL